MRGRACSSFYLLLAFLAICYAAVIDQGNPLGQPGVSLLILGLGTVIRAALTRRSSLPLRGDVLLGIALLFPVYVAFQLLPVPLFLLRLFDPTRAEIADALRIFTPF